MDEFLTFSENTSKVAAYVGYLTVDRAEGGDFQSRSASQPARGNTRGA